MRNALGQMTAQDRRDRGFTLVELMIVVVIIGILLAAAVASYASATASAYRSTCLADQRTLEKAALLYHTVHGEYPPDLDALAPLVIQEDATPTCPSDPDLEYTYDPASGSVSCPNHPGD